MHSKTCRVRDQNCTVFYLGKRSLKAHFNVFPSRFSSPTCPLSATYRTPPKKPVSSRNFQSQSVFACWFHLSWFSILASLHPDFVSFSSRPTSGCGWRHEARTAPSPGSKHQTTTLPRQKPGCDLKWLLWVLLCTHLRMQRITRGKHLQNIAKGLLSALSALLCW